MKFNHYENDILSKLHDSMEHGDIRLAGDAIPYFSGLSNHFPIGGNGIDWERVPGAVVQVAKIGSGSVQNFIDFFRVATSHLDVSGDVVFVGDGATDFAVSGSIAAMMAALPVLFDVPQHNYLIGPNYSWCALLSFEGDMAFGMR